MLCWKLNSKDLFLLLQTSLAWTVFNSHGAESSETDKVSKQRYADALVLNLSSSNSHVRIWSSPVRAFVDIRHAPAEWKPAIESYGRKAITTFAKATKSSLVFLPDSRSATIVVQVFSKTDQLPSLPRESTRSAEEFGFRYGGEPNRNLCHGDVSGFTYKRGIIRIEYNGYVTPPHSYNADLTPSELAQDRFNAFAFDLSACLQDIGGVAHTYFWPGLIFGQPFPLVAPAIEALHMMQRDLGAIFSSGIKFGDKKDVVRYKLPSYLANHKVDISIDDLSMGK